MALLYLGCSCWSCGLSQVQKRLPSSSDCAPPTQVPVPLSREPHPRALGDSPGCDCFNFQLCGFRQGAQGHGAPLSSATLTGIGRRRGYRRARAARAHLSMSLVTCGCSWSVRTPGWVTQKTLTVTTTLDDRSCAGERRGPPRPLAGETQARPAPTPCRSRCGH